MTGEAEEAGRSIFAGVGRVGHELLDLAQIGVEDDRAVQLDLDLRSLDGHFLEVPLADRAQIAACGGDHAVGRAVRLASVEGFRVLRVTVIQDLKLAHAVIGCVTLAGITDRQAVVACRAAA